MKPLNYISDNHVISISPNKAVYGLKKDYISITKKGFLLFEFTPLIRKNGENIPLWQDKEFYILNPDKALELGEYKVDGKRDLKERFIYNNKVKEFYFNKNDVMDSDRKVFNYKFIHNEKKLEFKGEIKEIEFVMIQRMINYSLPYMMGWHILNSNKIAEEDLINTPE